MNNLTQDSTCTESQVTKGVSLNPGDLGLGCCWRKGQRMLTVWRVGKEGCRQIHRFKESLPTLFAFSCE